MNFLENLAIGYVAVSEQSVAYSYLLFIVFALLFGWLKPVTWRMQRATYFLNSALIFLGVSISQGIWLFGLSAIADGYLSVIVALNVIISGIAAYALVIIMKSRSNDAFGHSRYAALGFIPIANFVLFFKPPKDSNIVKMPVLLSGVSAVVIGIGLLVAGSGFSVVIDGYIANSADVETRTKVRQRLVSYHLANGGLSDAFAYIKSSESLGRRLDVITVLDDIEISEDTLTFKFSITDTNIIILPRPLLNSLQDSICEDNKQLIEAGASVVFHYSSEAIPTLARLVGNTETCSP